MLKRRKKNNVGLIKGTVFVALLSSVSFGQLLNGAWVGVSPTAPEIANFQTLQDKKLDITHIFIDWVTTFSSLKTYADAAFANGSKLLVTWEPWTYTTVAIRDGKADAYITQMAKDIKAYSKDIFWLRPLHEANGNWYPWAIGDTSKVNTNDSYKAAFKHIVDLFKAQNVTNVKWVFNLNCDNVGVGTSYDGFYPGDAYVDYTSIDGYNWGTTQSWGSTWKTFDQIFSSAYASLSSINKPMFIPEFASAELGGNKAAWITDAFSTIAGKYPKIFATIWFSMNKETDWRINSTDAALTAYKAALKKYGTATAVESKKKELTNKFRSNAVISAPGVCSIDLSEKSSVVLSVFTVQGKLLYSRNISTLQQGSHSLSFPMPKKSGMYILGIRSNSRTQTIPIITKA